MTSFGKLWWGLAGLLFALVLLAYQWPVSIEPAQARARDFGAMALPTLPATEEARLDEQVSVVGRLPLFAVGSVESVAEGSSTVLQGIGGTATGEANWRITGVFVVDSRALVVVTFDDPAKPPLELRVGDPLPSGELIQAIDGNGVFVQTAAGEKSIYRAMDAVGQEKPGNK